MLIANLVKIKCAGYLAVYCPDRIYTEVNIENAPKDAKRINCGMSNFRVLANG